jgi:hypothetical protein
MVGPFSGVPYSFGALRKVCGPRWVRCDVCRRCARLHLGELGGVDLSDKHFQLLNMRQRRRLMSPARTAAWKTIASISELTRSTIHQR